MIRILALLAAALVGPSLPPVEDKPAPEQDRPDYGAASASCMSTCSANCHNQLCYALCACYCHVTPGC